jgi:hypothetical protein
MKGWMSWEGMANGPHQEGNYDGRSEGIVQGFSNPVGGNDDGK